MPTRFPNARSDLEYHERNLNGEDVVFVRDPVRNLYFRYNQLQAAMLRSLDGKRHCSQIIEELSEQFEVEIPPSTAEHFVQSAKERMLLDVSSYRVDPKRVRKELARALKKKGFRLRGMVDVEKGPAQRFVSAEAVLFAIAVRHLQRGEPAKATDYLAAVLELNPNNERARTLHTIVQTAYVRAAGSMADWPTYPLFDPTRLLRFLDATIGRVAFGWIGVLAMIAFACIGVYCFAVTPFAGLQFGAFDFGVAFLIYVAHGFVHEMGHALACHHYGGAVKEIGIQFNYYLYVIFYTDTSASYLFKERKHKMIVQLAGTINSIGVCSLLCVLVTVLHPGLAIYPGLVLALIMSTGIVFVNLIPFIKLDGYFLLCDILGQTNLRDRAFKLGGDVLRRHVLGLHVEPDQLAKRQRNILLVFAVASFLFTCVWLYSLYFRVFAPVVEHLRTTGLVIVLGFSFFLIRKVVIRPLWRTGRLVWSERRRVFTPRRAPAFALAGGLLIAPWFLIEWPVLVDSEFALVPVQRVDVRARTAGLIEEIYVAEGATVTAGQPLLRLRNDELELRRAELDAELAVLDARLAELEAGARPEELELASAQVSAARASQVQESSKAVVASRLAKLGLGRGADARALAQAAAATRGRAAIAEKKLSLVEAGTRPEQIAAARAERARSVAEIEAKKTDSDLLVVRSPIDGIVVTKHLRDRLRTMAGPGAQLLEIHNLSSFTAEIALPTSAPMGDLEPSDQIVLRPYGFPDTEISCTLDRVRDTVDAIDMRGGLNSPIGTNFSAGSVVVLTSPFAMPNGRASLRGHARLYGKRHSLAYSLFYLPIQRLLRIRLWSL